MAGLKCDGIPKPLTHLFFVDDLIIYATSKEFERNMEKMDESSKSSGVALGLQNVGWVIWC